MSRRLPGLSRFFLPGGPWLLWVLWLAACISAPVPAKPASQPGPVASPPGATSTAASPGPIPTALPSPSPNATAPGQCTAKTGSLETGVIETDLLYKAMRYTVYLPPCYQSALEMRYPVVYLLHGQGFSEDQWIRVGAVTAADGLIASGEAPPFMMVFPFDYASKQPGEYKFEQVFIELLIPHIDNLYRTQARAGGRAIGGLSRGGAWALHLGIGHPDLFGALGGHSPAIFFSDERPLMRSLLAIPPAGLPRIWLDAGESDSEYVVILPFEEFLSKNNIPHEWHAYVGMHDEKYWSAHVGSYLDWYAQGWK